MPEYLAPGVYVEEVSFRSKSIEGVSTTTTGFVGPARFGPVDIQPDILTSLADFERVYGDGKQLVFQDATMDNYLWHAARAFFEEGGKRLYVSRIFKPIGESDDGCATAWLPADAPSAEERKSSIEVRARFPGSAGNLRVRFTVRLGQNVLTTSSGAVVIRSLQQRDIVWIGDTTSPVSIPPGPGSLYLAQYSETGKQWQFTSAGSTPTVVNLTDLHPETGDVVRILTLSIDLISIDNPQHVLSWSGIAPDPQHQYAGRADSLFDLFAAAPSTADAARSIPLQITRGEYIQSGLDVIDVLTTKNTDLSAAIDNALSTDEQRSVEALMQGGNDGVRPGAAEYEGAENPDTSVKTGLVAFEDIEDISIVAAPGSTYLLDNGYTDDGMSVMGSLIAHAERMRYRIAVLDSGNNESIALVRALRGKLDSKYAALYYPWVTVLDPITRKEIQLPPSGFVAGIYARNDIERAVYKAPANEVVRLALGFERTLNKAQQDVLNPEGINCFRFFEGRGNRLWGARTISSDPEWKYVNLRRYFAYLERSIDKGTQWAVFEPNGEALWANIRRTIEDFLLNEWMMGALLGDKPEKAYFVKCDRSTMTQNDLDNGRLICLIGVAALRPAEFVIFRIGQWTADRKS